MIFFQKWNVRIYRSFTQWSCVEMYTLDHAFHYMYFFSMTRSPAHDWGKLTVSPVSGSVWIDDCTRSQMPRGPPLHKVFPSQQLGGLPGLVSMLLCPACMPVADILDPTSTRIILLQPEWLIMTYQGPHLFSGTFYSLSGWWWIAASTTFWMLLP